MYLCKGIIESELQGYIAHESILIVNQYYLVSRAQAQGLDAFQMLAVSPEGVGQGPLCFTFLAVMWRQLQYLSHRAFVRIKWVNIYKMLRILLTNTTYLEDVYYYFSYLIQQSHFIAEKTKDKDTKWFIQVTQQKSEDQDLRSQTLHTFSPNILLTFKR